MLPGLTLLCHLDVLTCMSDCCEVVLPWGPQPWGGLCGRQYPVSQDRACFCEEASQEALWLCMYNCTCVCVCVYGCVVSSLDIHLDFSYIYIADLFTKKM